MTTDDIITQIKRLSPVTGGNSYSLITMDSESGPFFGKNQAGNVCFVIPSNSAHPKQSSRATKELSLILDLECGFNIDGADKAMLSNILVCKSLDMFRHLVVIHVQTDAQHALLGLDLLI